jgi:hypothetical protein
MEETKKGNDESFEDVTSEVHALRTTLKTLESELQVVKQVNCVVTVYL